MVFDLDDTLYDCSSTLVLRGRKKVASTISKLINCSEGEAYQLQLEIEEKYGVKENIYEKIVALYQLPPTCANELLEEFIHIDISDIVLFPDIVDTLVRLKMRGYKLILITSGNNQIQQKKIDVLGLRNKYFDDIIIVDRNNAQTKLGCFRDTLQRYNLKPEEVLCVGDKIEDELTAGKMLGMPVVIFEHGRHYKAYLKEKKKHIQPDYFIKNVKELLLISQKFHKSTTRY